MDTAWHSRSRGSKVGGSSANPVPRLQTSSWNRRPRTRTTNSNPGLLQPETGPSDVTREEALANAADAIRLYIESLRARGLPVPEDQASVEEVRSMLELPL